MNETEYTKVVISKDGVEVSESPFIFRSDSRKSKALGKIYNKRDFLWKIIPNIYTIRENCFKEF